MSLRTRIHTWFSRTSTSRQDAKKAVARRRPTRLNLEILEDRLAPAVVNYNAGLLEFTADPGDSDNVTVAVNTALFLDIAVGNGDTITANGVDVGSFLRINTSNSPVSNFNINLGDQGDNLTFAVANANVTNVNIQGGTGIDAVALFVTINGDLIAESETINLSSSVVPNNVAVWANGDVSLTTVNSLRGGAYDLFPDIAGQDVTLTVTGVGNQIGLPGSPTSIHLPLQVAVGHLLNASTDDGHMALDSVAFGSVNPTRNLPLGTLDAGAAMILLSNSAATGGITDGNSGVGDPNLKAAGGVNLVTWGSNSSIGTAAHPIRTEIGALSATSNDGGIFVSDSNPLGLGLNTVLAKEVVPNQGVFGYPPVVFQGQVIIFAFSPSNVIYGTHDVSITAVGDILVNNVSATNDVTITTTGGSILDINLDGNNILARTVNLIAKGSIGQQADPIDLQAPHFTASTTNGGIFLVEGMVGTADSVVAGGAGNDVVVTSLAPTLRIKEITAPDNVTVRSDGGLLLSGKDVSLATDTIFAGHLSGLVTGGLVQYQNGGGSDIGGLVNNTLYWIILAGDGKIKLASTFNEAAFNIPIDLTSPGTGNAHRLVPTLADGGGNITQQFGALVFDPEQSTPKVSGRTVDLTGKSGIGTLADPFETAATTLVATVSDAVGTKPAAAINIKDVGTGLTSVGAKTNAGDAEITFLGGGSLAFSGKTSVLKASTSNVDLAFESTGGNVLLDVVNAGSGDVNVTALWAIADYTDSPSSTDDGPAAALDLIGGTVTLKAGFFIGLDGFNIETKVDTLNATAGLGSIVIREADGLTLSAATAGDFTNPVLAISVPGDIDVSTATGNLTLGRVSALKDVTLRAGGAIRDDADPLTRVAADTLTLRAASGIGDVALGTSVTALNADGGSGRVWLANDKALLLKADPTRGNDAITAGGDVSITAAGDLTLVGHVNAAGQSVTLAASGELIYTPDVVNVSSDTIFVGTFEGLGTGTSAFYSNGGGSSIGGLVHGTLYYVILAGNGRIQLAASAADAAAGVAIDLTLHGSGDAHMLGAIVFDPKEPTFTITGASATLKGSRIGDRDQRLETDVAAITATTTIGSIYVLNGLANLTLTATARGSKADIDVVTVGNIRLNTLTARGDTVKLRANGANAWIRDNNGDTVNILGKTFDVEAPGGVGTAGDSLETDVDQQGAANGFDGGTHLLNVGALLLTKETLEGGETAR